MRNTTQKSLAQRGEFYLLVLGVVGVVMAVCLGIVGFAEFWAGLSWSGGKSLVLGAFFGVAAVRVLMFAREDQAVIKNAPSGQ